MIRGRDVVTDFTCIGTDTVVTSRGTTIEVCSYSSDSQAFLNIRQIELYTSIHAVTTIIGGDHLPMIVACITNGIVLLSIFADRIKVSSFFPLPCSCSFAFSSGVCVADDGLVFKVTSTGVTEVANFRSPLIHAALAGNCIAALTRSGFLILNLNTGAYSSQALPILATLVYSWNDSWLLVADDKTYLLKSGKINPSLDCAITAISGSTLVLSDGSAGLWDGAHFQKFPGRWSADKLQELQPGTFITYSVTKGLKLLINWDEDEMQEMVSSAPLCNLNVGRASDGSLEFFASRRNSFFKFPAFPYPQEISRAQISEKITGMWSFNSSLLMSSTDGTLYFQVIADILTPMTNSMLARDQKTIFAFELGSEIIQICPSGIFSAEKGCLFRPVGGARISSADFKNGQIVISVGEGVFRGRGRICLVQNFLEISTRDFDREIRQVCFYDDSSIAVLTAEAGALQILDSRDLEISTILSLTASVESIAGLGDQLIIGTTHGAIIFYGKHFTLKRFLGAKPVKISKISENSFFTAAGRCSLWSKKNDNFAETVIASSPNAIASLTIRGHSIWALSFPGILEFSKLKSTGDVSLSIQLSEAVKFAQVCKSTAFVLDFSGKLIALESGNLKPKFLISGIEWFTAQDDFLVIAKLAKIALLRWDGSGFVEMHAIPMDAQVLRLTLNNGVLAVACPEALKLFRVDSRISSIKEISGKFENVRFLQVFESRIFCGDSSGLRAFSGSFVIGSEIDDYPITCGFALNMEIVASADEDGCVTVKSLSVDDAAVDILGPSIFKYVSNGDLMGDLPTSMVAEGERLYYTTLHGSIGCLVAQDQATHELVKRLDSAMITRLSTEMPWLSRSIGKPRLSHTSLDMCELFSTMSREDQSDIAESLGINLVELLDKIDCLLVNRLV